MNSNFCDVELILHPHIPDMFDLLISTLSRKKKCEWRLMIHTAGSLPGESINHGCYMLGNLWPNRPFLL